jgi:hypothetical protein
MIVDHISVTKAFCTSLERRRRRGRHVTSQSSTFRPLFGQEMTLVLGLRNRRNCGNSLLIFHLPFVQHTQVKHFTLFPEQYVYMANVALLFNACMSNYEHSIMHYLDCLGSDYSQDTLSHIVVRFPSTNPNGWECAGCTVQAKERALQVCCFIGEARGKGQSRLTSFEVYHS